MLQNSVQAEHSIIDSECYAASIARYEFRTAVYWRIHAVWAMKLCLWDNFHWRFDRT